MLRVLLVQQDRPGPRVQTVLSLDLRVRLDPRVQTPLSQALQALQDQPDLKETIQM